MQQARARRSEFLTIKQALLDPPDATASDIERLFFERLRLANGVFRTTASNRMNEVNAAAHHFITRYRRPRILDVAASSGVSSAEWSEALALAGVPHIMHVSDALIWATLVRRAGISLLYEPGIRPHLLQIDLDGMAFPISSGSRWRNLLFRLVKHALPHRALAASGQPVMLVGPTIRRHASKGQDVRFVELDIFDPDSRPAGAPFQVIRAANILISAYFPTEQLRAGLRNLVSLLDEGGILIALRTDSAGVNHASIHVREGQRLRRLETTGTGYEMDALLQDLVITESSL